MKMMSGLLTATVVICTAIGAAVCAAQQAPNYREHVAVRLWEQLYTLPDNPRATSAAHNVLLKKSAARVLIQEYALRKKTGSETGYVSGHVSPGDMGVALREINVASFAFAKKTFGHPPDDPGEAMNRLNRVAWRNPGLTVFMEMFWEYSER